MPEAPYTLTRKSDGTTTELRGTTVVGRADDCGLVIKEELASRTHALLTIEAGFLWIENQSRNGTSVNGSRLTARRKLLPGDRICFAVEEFVVSGSPPAAVAEDATILRSPAETRPLPPVDSRQVPRAWVAQSSSKTEFIDRKELIEASGADAVTDPAGQVEVPTLVIMSGQSAGSRIELNKVAQGGAQWTVGSDASQEVVLPDAGVSALHAALVSDGQRWQVVDKMSANGTFVNGKHTPKSYLSAGARIKFGPVECVLLLPRSTANAAAKGAAGGAGKQRAVVIGVISFLATIAAVTAFYFLSR
jgi:pSer/pThr/pTyr-binding forkhead associated (FHA) protein